jgi:hypothetical protein
VREELRGRGGLVGAIGNETIAIVRPEDAEPYARRENASPSTQERPRSQPATLHSQSLTVALDGQFHASFQGSVTCVKSTFSGSSRIVAGTA